MDKKKLSADDAALLIVFASIIFGTWFRLMPAWIAGFPINDGGMFDIMIRDLQANHYAPPLVTTYNNLGIPFVYPPLGFYLGAFITDLFHLSSPLAVLQWFPGILNALCIPAFYRLAREILGNKLQGAMATLVYALIPFMSLWNSMGGGLTRALGALFTILALTHIQRVFADRSKKDILGAIIFSSLVTLSHTEAPIYLIALALYFWGMKSRTREGLLHGVLIALGVLVLALPWYGWIVYRHGFAPLISASQTGFHSVWSILRLINIHFVTGEPYLDLLGAISILGVALLVARRNYFIPGMALVIYLAEPRSAHTIGNIPLAMAAGFFIAEMILPAASKVNTGDRPEGSWNPGGLLAFTLVLIPYLLSNSIYYGLRLSEMHVSTAEREAMKWVAANTPETSKFLVITGEPNGFCDATSEWFPALAGRQSLATLQGNEWLKGRDFSRYVGQVRDLQSCAAEGLDCLMNEAENFDPGVDYLYVSNDAPTLDCNVTDRPDSNRRLITELEGSTQFQEVFHSAEAVIFVNGSPPK